MNTGHEPSIIYIVDDDGDIRDSLAMLLRSAGFRAEVFASGEDILADAERLAHGCLVVDVCLPGQDGVQVLRALQQRGVTLPVIFMTGHPGAVADLRRAMPGEVAVLQKPMSDEALFSAIREALRRHGDGRGEGGRGEGGGSEEGGSEEGGSEEGGSEEGGSEEGGSGGPAYAVSTTEPCGYTPEAPG